MSNYKDFLYKDYCSNEGTYQILIDDKLVPCDNPENCKDIFCEKIEKMEIDMSIHGKMDNNSYFIIPKNGCNDINITLNNIPGVFATGSLYQDYIDDEEGEEEELFKFKSGDIMFDIYNSVNIDTSTFGNDTKNIFANHFFYIKEKKNNKLRFKDFMPLATIAKETSEEKRKRKELDKYLKKNKITYEEFLKNPPIEIFNELVMNDKNFMKPFNDLSLSLFSYDSQKISKDSLLEIYNTYNTYLNNITTYKEFLEKYYDENKPSSFYKKIIEKITLELYNDKQIEKDEVEKKVIEINNNIKQIKFKNHFMMFSEIIKKLMEEYPNRELNIVISTCLQYENKDFRCPFIPYLNDEFNDNNELMYNKVYQIKAKSFNYTTVNDNWKKEIPENEYVYVFEPKNEYFGSWDTEDFYLVSKEKTPIFFDYFYHIYKNNKNIRNIDISLLFQDQDKTIIFPYNYDNDVDVDGTTKYEKIKNIFSDSLLNKHYKTIEFVKKEELTEKLKEKIEKKDFIFFIMDYNFIQSLLSIPGKEEIVERRIYSKRFINDYYPLQKDIEEKILTKKINIFDIIEKFKNNNFLKNLNYNYDDILNYVENTSTNSIVHIPSEHLCKLLAISEIINENGQIDNTKKEEVLKKIKEYSYPEALEGYEEIIGNIENGFGTVNDIVDLMIINN